MDDTIMATVIKRPSDAALVTKLRAKLEEYKRRLAEDERERPAGLHSEAKTRHELDSIFKIRILQEVLEKGAVTEEDFTQVLKEELSAAAHHSSSFQERLYNAFRVIEDYCRTGGQGVHGGTGLR